MDAFPSSRDRATILRIIYRSTMAFDWQAAGASEIVSNIIQQSRDWNAEYGVTGALLADAGSFSQVLEGSPSVLKSLFGHISLEYPPSGRNPA